MACMSCQKTEKSLLKNVLNINQIHPSLEDLAIGFSIVLQAKIIEDLESKGSTHSLINETFFNRDHLLRFLNSDLKDVPLINEIFSFTFNWYHSARLSEEHLILTLMYILRVLKTSEIKIFAGNWQIIIIAATLTSLRICDSDSCCSLQFENFFTGLNFDEIFELDREFSHLMESKYQVDLSYFERCLEILSYALDAESQKKWELNLEKINKIIRVSKNFDEKEEEEDCEPKIIKSERIYNIDLDKYYLDN